MSTRVWVALFKAIQRQERALIPQSKDYRKEYRKRELAIPFSFQSVFILTRYCYWRAVIAFSDHPRCVMISLIVFRCSTHGLLLCFILLHISNGSVSTSLVGHILYSADLMSAICIPHILLMVHRYIYSRYSPVFPILYQLYHSFPSSTLNSSSSLYLSVVTWVTP